MSTQLFICNHDAPMPELFVPVENDPEGYFRQKPKGGLWTSTWNEKGQDSDWVAWCRGEDFGDPDNKRWFLLTPKSTCRLYTIDSLKDFQQCLRDYGCPTPIAQKHPIFALKRTIDFERLALEYDGLHLTEQGNEETHLSHPNDLNGWDCESTLWFRWCFADVQAIPTPKSQPLSLSHRQLLRVWIALRDLLARRPSLHSHA